EERGAVGGRVRAVYDTWQLPHLPRFEFDSAYVQRLIAEDPETERHFTRYFGDLLSLKLGSRLRSRALVEDAKQETFVRVLTTLKRKGGLESAGRRGGFGKGGCNHGLVGLFLCG